MRLATLCTDSHVKGARMFGWSAAAYVVAISAMLFAGACGLTLFYFVDHLDPPGVPAELPEVRPSQKEVHENVFA
jgi:hypothetical protein